MPVVCPTCSTEIKEAEPGDLDVECKECSTIFNAARPDGPVGMLLPGDALGGFEILGHIGSGGMGLVYLAKQVSLNREVALKTLSEKYTNSPEVTKRFLLEVRATASLEHPNIVTLFEAGEKRGICFLAMAYVDGISLDEMLESQDKPLAEDYAMRIARDVAGALEYAWRKQKLLHRDIKPGNIMVDKVGTVKLLDLGIAKRPDDDFQITQHGMAIGTPHYMSPEQARASEDLDFRSDMYSLGATVFHLVTGSYPFEGESSVAVLTKHIYDPTPDARERNPEVTLACARVISGMMAKDRDDRYRDWGALIDDIDRFLESAEPTGAPKRTDATTSVGERPPSDPNLPALWPLRRSPRATGQAPAAAKVNLLHVAGFLVILILLLVWLILSVREPRGPSASTSPAAPPLAPEVSGPVEPGRSEEPAPTVEPEARVVPSRPDFSDESLRQEIEAAIDEGKSPLDGVNDYYRRDDLARAEKMAWLVLMEYEGPRQGWAHAAGRILSVRYRATKDDKNLEAVLRRRLELGAGGRIRDLHSTYAGLAALLARLDRGAELEELLWQGLKETHDRRGMIASECAKRLIEFYERTGNDRKRAECVDYALRHPRISMLDYPFFRNYAKKNLPAVWEQHQRGRIDAKASRLAAKLEGERIPVNRARLLLDIGGVYRDEGLARDALKHYKQAFEQYAEEDGGEVGAQALIAMADCHQALGNAAAWLGNMTALMVEPFQGEDGRYGLQAARAMAAFYEAQKDDTLRVVYLKKIVENFPGERGNAAIQAGFELARYYESKKRYFMALSMLNTIRTKFPAADPEYAGRALRELRRMVADHPTEAKKYGLGLSPLEVGPFTEFISFNGRTDHIAVVERDLGLTRSKEVSVEAWVLRNDGGGAQEYIFSRHGDNDRGFNLYLDGGRLVWEIYDGRNRTELRLPTTVAAPLRQWTHVVAAAGNGRMAIYLDGKRVAEKPAGKVENDGAGHLKIGRCSWQERGYFRGYLQNIAVYTKVSREGDFVPSVKAERLPGAHVYVVKRGKETRDLLRNRLDLGPR